MDTALIATQLQQRLDELRSRLDHIKSDVVQPHSADSAEQAQERENDEVLDQIGHETRLAMHNIEQALARIASGDYGTCVACGDPIAPARLEVIPESIRCVKCAD